MACLLLPPFPLPQGLSFFLPNMTWLGPAGQYHALLSSTWAAGALAVTGSGGNGISVSAQKDVSGARVVVRLTNKNTAPANVNVAIQGFTSQTNVKVTSLTGTSTTQTNTPANPLAIAPVVSYITLPSGGGSVAVPALTVMALELTAA